MIENKITKNLKQSLFRYYCRYCFKNIPNNFWAYSIPIDTTFEQVLECHHYRIEQIEKLKLQELNLKKCKLKINSMVIKKLGTYFMLTPMDFEDEVWKLEATLFINQIYLATQEWTDIDNLYKKTTECHYEEFIESIKMLIQIKFLVVKIEGRKYRHSIIDISREKFLKSDIHNLLVIMNNDELKVSRNSHFINLYSCDSCIQENVPKIKIHDIRVIISLFTLSALRNEVQIENMVSEILDERYGIESMVPILDLIRNPRFKEIEKALNKKEDSLTVKRSELLRLIDYHEDYHSLFEQYKEIVPLIEEFSVIVRKLANDKIFLDLNKVCNYKDVFDNRFLFLRPSNTGSETIILDIGKNANVGMLQHHYTKYSGGRIFSTDYIWDDGNMVDISELYIYYSRDSGLKLFRKENKWNWVEVSLQLASLVSDEIISSSLLVLLILFSKNMDFRINHLENYSHRNHLCRLEYNGIIFRRETWIYINRADNFNEFYSEMLYFLNYYHISDNVDVFIEKDILAINPYLEYQWKKLYSLINCGTQIVFYERLEYDLNYSGEFILNYQADKDRTDSHEIEIKTDILDRKNSSNNWIYFEVYVVDELQKCLISNVIDIVQNYSNYDFHYVRYQRKNIPTLRMRVVHYRDKNEEIMQNIHRLLVGNDFEYVIRTFYPEVNRYGGIRHYEKIYSYFTYDSLLCNKINERIAYSSDDAVADLYEFYNAIYRIDRDSLMYIKESMSPKEIKLARKYVYLLHSQNNIFGSFKDFNEYEEHISNLDINELRVEQRASIYQDIAHMHFNRMVGIYSDFDERLINNTAIYKVCEDIRRLDH